MGARKGLTFTHMGFYVSDLALMEDFYANVLDFTVTDRGDLSTPGGRVQLVFLSRDPDHHHQIVLASGRPPAQGFNVINQISFMADSLQTLLEFHERLRRAPVSDIQPVTHGNAVSIYFRDPEGNRIELYFDLPWYVSQPARVPLPIELPYDELLAWTEAHARTLPGFQPRDAWRARMAQRMGIEG